MRFAGDILRHQLGEPLDFHMRARLAHPLRDGVCHHLDMPVGGIEKNQNLCHSACCAELRSPPQQMGRRPRYAWAKLLSFVNLACESPSASRLI
jgi:hypothetical protein